jgi:hypothetical protein
MRAVVVQQHGGPGVLQGMDWPDPSPGPGDLLIAVAAAGVNFMDIYRREGRPPYHGDTPYVPGAEGAGTVTAVGTGVTGFSPGDRVAWPTFPNSYAERVVVPAERAVRVPDGVELEVAAAVMLQGMTAHYLCHSTRPVAAGDPVVVHAAAGGVGPRSTCSGSRQPGPFSSPGRRSGTTSPVPRKCSSGPMTCSAGSPAASSRSGSAAGTRWLRRPGRTRTSRPVGPPASCSCYRADWGTG